MSKTLRTGDDLKVRILARRSDLEWVVSCTDIPPDWAGVIRSREPRSYEPGDELEAWIFQVDVPGRKICLSDSDFGRMPVSDRMRPRYLASLKCFIEACKKPGDGELPDSESVSELKGMFNRCIKKDQWDWLTVYFAFGRPPYDLLSNTVSQLYDLGKAVRAGETEQARILRDAIANADFVNLLESAAATIKASTPHLSEGHELATTASSRLPQPWTRSPLSVTHSYDKTKLDWANEEHAGILAKLVEFLASHGHEVECDKHIDAYCRLRLGPAIFEAKSVRAENELSQVRAALSQLYEYRFRSGEKDASLWIALSGPPEQTWLIDYLENDRSIHLIWLENGEFTGPSVGLLLESGIAALRRRSQNQG